MQIAPRMTRAHYKFLADTLGPLVSWPSHLHVVADELAATNPRFDKEKFLRRAIKAWEDKHDIEPINDEIPY